MLHLNFHSKILFLHIYHEFIFTIQEGIDAIEDLIYHLETFDVTKAVKGEKGLLATMRGRRE